MINAMKLNDIVNRVRVESLGENGGSGGSQSKDAIHIEYLPVIGPTKVKFYDDPTYTYDYPGEHRKGCTEYANIEKYVPNMQNMFGVRIKIDSAEVEFIQKYTYDYSSNDMFFKATIKNFNGAKLEFNSTIRSTNRVPNYKNVSFEMSLYDNVEWPRLSDTEVPSKELDVEIDFVIYAGGVTVEEK